MSQSINVTQKLRKMILSMELGPGEALTERWAEGCFNASRTPVRAAFQKLEAEGLLQRDGKRWMITPIRIDELEQLYCYREVLEIAALKSSAGQFTEEQLNSLDNLCNTPLNPDLQDIFEDSGTMFHLKLASHCGNKYIISSLQDVLRQLYRVRWLEMSPDNPAVTDHQTIITALKDQDCEKACNHLKLHLREGCRRLIETISSNKRSLRASGIIIE